MSRSIALLLSTALAWVALARPADAQSPFTVDDAFEVGTVRVLDLSPDGRWLAASTLDLNGRLGTNSHRTGDPTYVNPALSELYVVDTRSGEQMAVFERPVQIGAVRWSPDGNRLALTLYQNERFRLGMFTPGSGRVDWVDLPMDVRLAGEQGQALVWTEDGERLLIPVRPHGWLEEAQAEFSRLTEGPITHYRGDDPFLAWEGLRRRGADVAVFSLDLRDRQPDERLGATTVGQGGYHVVGDRLVFEADVTEKTSYDVIFGSTVEVRVQHLDGSDGPSTVTVVPENRRLRWSQHRTHYGYEEDGDVYLGDLNGDDPVRLTGEDEEEDTGPDEAPGEPDAADEQKERFTVLGVSPHGAKVAASSPKGLYLIAADTKDRTLMVALPEDAKERDTAPRYQLVAWDPAGDAVYFTRNSATEWARGMIRYDVGAGRITPLFEDEYLYSGFRLSDDGSTWVFSRASGNRPYDLYRANADFTDVRRVMDVNPWLSTRTLGDTELIDYLDVDGDRLHGVLYYPVGYQTGTPVPTVFLVYERFFDDRFNSTIAVLNNQGYAVMQPSVDLEVGFPGEAWLKGVTAAANTLIERGVTDPDRMGVHGTSYGGYATNLLVTQTDRFAAAINISGKVDMISFYTDSPRLGVRNIHAPENSQDRIGATLWEQPQKYIDHSAIMFADRIETPVLLMTGEQDHNVPERTTLEMYYALRRLGKTVEWVSYNNGGHGMPRTTEAEVRDYYARIVGWYNRFLKEDPPEAATQNDRSSR